MKAILVAAVLLAVTSAGGAQDDHTLLFSTSHTSEIRLVGGRSQYEGRVEVNRSGEWQTVCDDSWDIAEAEVVCRWLGYGYAILAIQGAAFGQGSGRQWERIWQCNGNEASLDDCSSSSSFCFHSEDASVICSGSALRNGALRLVNTGGTQFGGRLEVYYNNEWGTVCADGWGSSDATVACRQMGFVGVSDSDSSSFGSGVSSQNIWLDNVACNGSELQLIDCSHAGIGNENCGHHEDVGIICIKDTPPFSSDFRLVGGRSQYEGRVEVNRSGEWQTVCDNSWDIAEAEVVCRWLGYGYAILAIQDAAFGQGSGRQWEREWYCNGNETSLDDCSSSKSSCFHSDDASVICSGSALSNGALRLVNPRSTQFGGRLEVYYNNEWGTVCDDGWDSSDATVACRQMGFVGVSVSDSSRFGSGVSSQSIWLDDVSCNGSESRLIDCSHAGIGLHNCIHSEDVRIVCTHAAVNACIADQRSERRCYGSAFDCQYGSSQGVCIDNTCRCPELPNRDPCTCLPRIGDCHIEQSSQSPNVYSCLVPDNLDVNYDVHIISVYEASSNRFFGQHPTGTSNVRLFVSGEVMKPIILVLVSYEPIKWRLSIPSGVEIERVLLSSYFLENSNVVDINDRVKTIERVSRQVFPSGYGHDSGGGDTVKLLESTVARFGSITSFRGTYRASHWSLHITHGNQTHLPECQVQGEDYFDGVDSCVPCTGTCEEPTNICTLECRRGCGCPVGTVLDEEANACVNVTDCPNDTTPISSDFRLVGGRNQYEGRVEVNRSGEWQTVCDDSWDITEAEVVCRWLGYGYAILAIQGAAFGQGSGRQWERIWYCSGSETSLDDCSSSSTACSHSEDASVMCSDSALSNGALRLVNTGSTQFGGRLEVYYNNEWGTVCDDGWDSSDATVACRQMGFVGVSDSDSSRFGSGVSSQSIWLDDVACNGSESQLINCSHAGIGFHNCIHSEDVGIVCTNDTPPFSSDVRLVGGRSQFEGRVEVNRSGEWQTVCDDSWDITEAEVVCRWLGYGYAILAIQGAAFGQGSGRQWERIWQCNGNETSLDDCSSSGSSCFHFEDASVICSGSALSNGALRLVNPRSTQFGGRLEVYYNNEWGTVCDDGWDSSDATVACRQMGFVGVSDSDSSRFGSGVSSQSIWLDDVSCNGSESQLIDCSHAGIGFHNCTHSEDVRIVCTNECQVQGEEYFDGVDSCVPCTGTCEEPTKVCTLECRRGCGCPVGTVLDEEANACVTVTDCPKDPSCPQECSRGFCRRKGPNAECSVPGSTGPACTGACHVTKCRACYYSKEVHNCPEGCRYRCGEDPNRKCFKNWSKCVKNGFGKMAGRKRANRFKCVDPCTC